MCSTRSSKVNGLTTPREYVCDCHPDHQQLRKTSSDLVCVVCGVCVNDLILETHSDTVSVDLPLISEFSNPLFRDDTKIIKYVTKLLQWKRILADISLERKAAIITDASKITSRLESQIDFPPPEKIASCFAVAFFYPEIATPKSCLEYLSVSFTRRVEQSLNKSNIIVRLFRESVQNGQKRDELIENTLSSRTLVKQYYHNNYLRKVQTLENIIERDEGSRTLTEICDDVRFSRRTYNRLKRKLEKGGNMVLGPKTGGYPDEIKNQVRSLADQGYSVDKIQEEIAFASSFDYDERIELSTSTIYRYLQTN